MYKTVLCGLAVSLAVPGALANDVLRHDGLKPRSPGFEDRYTGGAPGGAAREAPQLFAKSHCVPSACRSKRAVCLGFTRCGFKLSREKQMSNRKWPVSLKRGENLHTAWQGLPCEVVRAQGVDWSVYVDAYLFSAARVGERYVALVYNDQSRKLEDGMTVATPPVWCVEEREGFKLVRTAGGDNYVISSEQNS